MARDSILKAYRSLGRELRRLTDHYEWCDDRSCYPVDDVTREVIIEAMAALRRLWSVQYRLLAVA